jgi:hypothetical protein
MGRNALRNGITPRDSVETSKLAAYSGSVDIGGWDNFSINA